MTVFCDSTILAKFDELIRNGDSRRTKGCAYSFVAGKIFPSPQPNSLIQKGIIDWTIHAEKEWPGEEVYEVCPGELVTLRTREIVNMPIDVCGIWNQTDALSRKGLLLVNISTVPPGYQGHLTCTFVNFGMSRVRIQPGTRVAKLMFLSLDCATSSPSKPWETQVYDSSMSAMASEFPATFLGISEQSRKLEELVATGVSKIASATENLKLDAIKQLNASMDDACANFKASATSDTRSVVLKAFPLALTAILFLAIAQWGATKILTENVEAVSKARADQIEEKIDKQLDSVRSKPVFVYSGSEESKALLERMKALEDQIRVLEAEAKTK